MTDEGQEQRFRCVECGTDKPAEEFHRERARPNGRNRRCKSCRNARNREHVARDPERRRQSMTRWRTAHPERYSAAQRAYKLRLYGLTVSDFQELLEVQHGACAICGDAETGGWDLAVDHDHDTGHVRGLLCRRCNAGIGLLREDPAVLVASADYLRRSGRSQHPRRAADDRDTGRTEDSPAAEAMPSPVATSCTGRMISRPPSDAGGGGELAAPADAAVVADAQPRSETPQVQHQQVADGEVEARSGRQDGGGAVERRRGARRQVRQVLPEHEDRP